MEEKPKWEDLNTDCLVNIFLRVDMENMLLDVPYVCKSWYKVTCTPHCWTTLNFPGRLVNIFLRVDMENMLLERINTSKEEDQRNRPAVNSFIKHVVKRSNGLATFVELPSSCTKEAIVFISKECPNLKTLLLPVHVSDFPTRQFPSLVSKWKRLEKLRLCWSLDSFDTREIIVQIGIHCNKFQALKISQDEIGKEEASALGAFLPNLKVLSLRYARISKENMLLILNCCKKLEVLDARDCVGFYDDDDDILKSAAHITRVNFEGSRLNDDFYDYLGKNPFCDANYCERRWRYA